MKKEDKKFILRLIIGFMVATGTIALLSIIRGT